MGRNSKPQELDLQVLIEIAIVKENRKFVPAVIWK